MEYQMFGLAWNSRWTGNQSRTGRAELANIAVRIANGTRAEQIPIQEAPTIAMFDWRQLRRWGIREDNLPLGSVVKFKELSFWNSTVG
jgi:hypothetical protein